MNIRYVVSTMVFWWREHHLSFEQECDFLKKLGFGIELWPTIKGNNDCRYDRRNWTRLKHATEGMVVALNSRHDGPDINDWTEQIECAQYLEAPIVANLKSLCISDELGIADWGFATEVMAIAKEKGVTLCAETGSLPALLQVGEKFEDIRFCLDTGFMHIDDKAGFKAYVDQLADKTAYVHLADNYGKLDDHEPPGVRGGMPKENWMYLLEGLKKYDNGVTVSFEMFPSMPGTMINQASKFIFDFLKWPDKPEPKTEYSSYRPL